MFDVARPTRVAGAIDIIDDAFDASACQRLLNLVERGHATDWQRAAVGEVETISDVRTSDAVFLDFGLLTNPLPVYAFGQRLFHYLDDYGRRYSVKFSSMEAACINRYEVGQSYKAHSDAGPGFPRIISGLVYLNDVESGGETYFPLFDVAVQPKAGRLVIFPSNYAYQHEARPPLEGTKYSLALWTR